MTGSRLGRRSFVVGAGLMLGNAGAAFAAPAKPRVLITTNHGTILVELEAERAPLTSTNFLRYVDHKDYDGGAFFRASRDPGAPSRGTIVGAPNPLSHPFPPIHHESTTKTGLRHLRGTLSLGRFGPDTATSNFFICSGPEPYLDAHPGAKGDNLGFAAFGQVVDGLPVVDKILSLPTNGKTRFVEQRGQWLKPPVPILSMRRA
ncbi:MAG TPA: peptidylprolyl isomerase [Caulobacteraceae bacterium]|jgi:peptidyl-prolyl cis-trans isomerase A (cyclophilin A)